MPQLPPKINLSDKEKWKTILEEVEKKEIPVEVMEKITVNIIDGSAVDINIREMIEAGDDPNDVHHSLQAKLDEMENIIDDIDFHINIDAVVDAVQPVTDRILKNL